MNVPTRPIQGATVGERTESVGELAAKLRSTEVQSMNATQAAKTLRPPPAPPRRLLTRQQSLDRAREALQRGRFRESSLR